jgi:site-specific DNA recombinase
MIHYYRCIGSDAYRHLGGSLCDNRPVRQDVLDEVVWREVIRLLEDPTLIKEELERRLAAAKDAAPSKRREDTLNRELVRIQKSIERLTTAYQEDLLSLDELRQRLPALRQREGAHRAELQSITDQIATRSAYLRLAQTLTAFLDRVRESADTLDVAERQRIVRLVVKEVLVVDDTIVIRHSIPVPGGAPDGTERTPPHADAQRAAPAASAQPATATASLQPAAPAQGQHVSSESYLLRSGRHDGALRRPLGRIQGHPILQHTRLQPFLDETDHSPIADSVFQETYHPLVADRIEEPLDIGVENPPDVSSLNSVTDRVQRIVLAASRSEPIAETQKLRLVYRRQDCDHGCLDNFVLDGSNAERPLFAVRLRDVNPSRR